MLVRAAWRPQQEPEPHPRGPGAWRARGRCVVGVGVHTHTVQAALHSAAGVADPSQRVVPRGVRVAAPNMVRLCGKRQEPEPEQEPEWSLVTLQITLPSRLTGGLRPPRTSLAQMAAGAQSELTCAGLNAGWSRRASVAAWRCNIVAADPPMADGPLDNSAALRGCAQLSAALRCSCC